MGIKRTAKSSDYKRAMSELKNREGIVEGTPNSILISLGFDGSWNEFRTNINALVYKTELGRYAVQLSESTSPHNNHPQNISITDPGIFAMCASAFILGEGEIEDFDSFTGRYENINEVIVPLASEIDSTISGLYLPFRTEQDVELYSLERSIFYSAEGDGLFTLYGASVLAHA